MQRVHKCLNRLGPSSFAILPLCTSSAIDLRRIERLYIQRLQPTLNVLHTVRGRRMVRVLQAQKREKLQYPAYIASRLRTAYTHVMRDSLGVALPPSMGKALACSVQKMSLPALGHDLSLTAHRTFLSQRGMLQPEYSEASGTKLVATLTTFRITTTYESVTTTDLHTTWPAVLSQCPQEAFLHGFCATTCTISIEKHGTIVARTANYGRINYVVWSPFVVVILTIGTTVQVPIWKGLHYLEDGRAAQMITLFTSPALRENPDTILVLYDIGRQPGSIYWTLRQYSMSDTISLWMTTPVIRSTPWKETVRGALRCYMRKRWRFDPTARPLIRIPS